MYFTFDKSSVCCCCWLYFYSETVRTNLFLGYLAHTVPRERDHGPRLRFRRRRRRKSYSPHYILNLRG